jgi:hypothetical protein
MERVRAALVGTGGRESHGRDQRCVRSGGRAHGGIGEKAGPVTDR